MIESEKFVASGWLGLILGTKMWYAFWPSAVASPTAFTMQMDALCREIGERGKPKQRKKILADRVPTLDADGRLQLRLDPVPATSGASTAAAAALPVATTDAIESSAGAIIQLIMAELREVRNQAERQAQRFTDEQRPPAPRVAVTPEQLAAAQDRLARLFTAELISQDNVHQLEDSVADFIELSASVGPITCEMLSVGSVGTPREHFAAAAKVYLIVALSEGISSDAGLARQLNRKVCI